MEFFCILINDNNVEIVREKVRNSQIIDHDIFNIGVSPTGNKPATHWICVMKKDDPLVPTILSMQEYCEMETSNLKTFLNSKNLKLAIR